MQVAMFWGQLRMLTKGLWPHRRHPCSGSKQIPSKKNVFLGCGSAFWLSDESDINYHRVWGAHYSEHFTCCSPWPDIAAWKSFCWLVSSSLKDKILTLQSVLNCAGAQWRPRQQKFHGIILHFHTCSTGRSYWSLLKGRIDSDPLSKWNILTLVVPKSSTNINLVEGRNCSVLVVLKLRVGIRNLVSHQDHSSARRLFGYYTTNRRVFPKLLI